MRMRTGSVPSHRRQQGVALAVGLMILLLLTILGVTSMRGSIFELQMARNEESRISAFERAQSIIDSTISLTNNLKGAEHGDTNCTDNVADCTYSDLSLDDELVVAPHGTRTSAKVTYMSCLDKIPRRLNASEDEFDSAQFKVEGTYDAADARLGRSSLVQGVLLVIRQGPQGACP